MTPADKQEKARHNSPGALIRRSGLLAVGAGAYMFVLPFVHPSDDVGVQAPPGCRFTCCTLRRSRSCCWSWSGSSPDNSSGQGGSAWPGSVQRFAMVLNQIAWLGAYSFTGNECER